MKKSILILFVTVLSLSAALPSRAQQIVRFNPDYALSEVRADYGLYTPMSVNGRGAKYFGIDYSRRFFGHLAWEAGAQYRLSAVGFQSHIGFPLSIAYKTGTVSFDQAVAYGAGAVVSDIIWGRDILSSIIHALFRRSEFFIGITPGLYTGEKTISDDIETNGRFSLTGDFGMVLSIPLWRVSINVKPTFHYSFINNIDVNAVPQRWWFSISAGLGFLF